jgi:hypothetical protein
MNNRISDDPRYDAWCPTCRAAIGAPCTKPVNDGSKFVAWVHEERKPSHGNLREA